MAIRRGTERARPIPGTGMRAYDPEGMTVNLIVCVCVQVTSFGMLSKFSKTTFAANEEAFNGSPEHLTRRPTEGYGDGDGEGGEGECNAGEAADDCPSRHTGQHARQESTAEQPGPPRQAAVQED